MAETRFTCPECGVSARSAKDLAPGTQIRCPSCKVVFTFQPPTQAAPAKPRPSAVRNEPAAAPPPRREEPRSAPRRRNDDDDDYDDRPRRRPQKKSSGLPILLIGGLALALVIGVAGAAIAIIAFSGGKDTKTAVQPTPPAPPVNVASNQPNPRLPGGPGTGLPVGPPVGSPTGPNVGLPVGPAPKAPSTSTPPKKTDSSSSDPGPAPSAPAGSGSGDIYQYVLKSTAWILNLMPGGKVAGGTGSVVDANERLILTNFHVVANSQDLVVFFPMYENGKIVAERDRYMNILKEKLTKPGDLLHAEIIAQDAQRDLALIRVPKLPAGTETLPLAKSLVNIGQTVHSVGNPGASGSLWVYTQGAVRAVYRKKWQAGGGDLLLNLDAEVVETQSPTNHGDSGGPLVNDRGEIVGVTEGGSSEAHLISVFISLNEARDFIEREYQRKFAKAWSPVGRAPLRLRGGGGGDVTTLINALDHKEAANRASAAKSLGDMGPDAKLAIRRLIKALKDPDELTSRTAADALSKIGAPGRDDLPALLEALKDQKTEVRRYASAAIGQIGPDAASAAEPLAGVLSDEDERVREGAVRSLGSLGPGVKAVVAPRLTKAFQDGSKSVRVAAASALTNLMSPPRADDVPLLETVLKQKDPEASVFGARALAKVGKAAKDAIPTLMEVAKAGDAGVRREAIDALSAVGPDAKTAAPLYVAALKDASADAGVKQSALLALGGLGKDLEKDKETVAAVLEAVKDSDKQVKKAALAAVGKLGPVIGAPGAKQVMPTVIDFLQETDAGLRDQAYETIAGLGPLARDAVKPLIDIMEKKDVKLYVKQQGGKPFLLEADEQFLDKIAKTIGKIGQPAVQRLLQSLTVNSNAGLIIGTCRALGEIGPPAKQALPALAELSRLLSPESGLGAEADRAARKIRR